MYSIDKFIDNTLFLTNSLIIKISDIAKVINNGIYIKYGEKPSSDPTEWKYYMNLAGIKHFSNSDVKVYVIETDRLELLSKELLDQYPYTRKELCKHGDAYKELINNYPDDIDFIKGCLYPVDIQKAIDAKDGTILNYNKEFVETQELSLIRELEAEIYGFLSRWHVRNYIITDELYLSSLIGVLYSTLPATIINLRSKKIYTAEAHSFHLEHFFRSRLDLWEQVSILNNKTKYWLYQNLNYLMVNIGKNTTLDTILQKVFEENNIGVGTFVLDKGQPKTKNTYDINVSNVTNSESRFIAKKLNNKYEISKDKYFDTESIINMELFSNPDLDTTIRKDALHSFVKETTNAITNTDFISQKTKLLDIDSIKLFKIFGNDPFESIVEHWLYFSINGFYNNKQIFIDPNTNNAYPLTPLEGLYFLYYMLLKLIGKGDTKIRKLKYGYVVNNDITVDELVSNTYNTGPTLEIAKLIKESMPEAIGILNTPEELKEYLIKLKEFYMKVWIYDSNINNGTISSNIKHMVTRMYRYGKVFLREDRSSVSFKTLLAEAGVYVNVTSEYDIIKTITSLFKTFTGVEINENIEIERRIKSYANLLLKLTSYTTQVIKSIDDNNALYALYSTVEPFHSEEGLINITSAEIVSPYETVQTLIRCNANDFRDMLSTSLLDTLPKAKYCDNITGILTLKNDSKQKLSGSITEPNLWVEVMSSCYNEYAPSVNTKGNNFIDNIDNNLVYTENIYNNDIGINCGKDIGILTIDDMSYEMDGDILEPNLSIEIIDKCYDPYTPTITSEGNNFEDQTNVKLVHTQNQLTEVKDIENNNLITYTNELNNNILIGIETTPNLIVEFDEND